MDPISHLASAAEHEPAREVTMDFDALARDHHSYPPVLNRLCVIGAVEVRGGLRKCRI